MLRFLGSGALSWNSSSQVDPWIGPAGCTGGAAAPHHALLRLGSWKLRGLLCSCHRACPAHRAKSRHQQEAYSVLPEGGGGKKPLIPWKQSSGWMRSVLPLILGYSLSSVMQVMGKAAVIDCIRNRNTTWFIFILCKGAASGSSTQLYNTSCCKSVCRRHSPGPAGPLLLQPLLKGVGREQGGLVGHSAQRLVPAGGWSREKSDDGEVGIKKKTTLVLRDWLWVKVLNCIFWKSCLHTQFLICVETQRILNLSALCFFSCP